MGSLGPALLEEEEPVKADLQGDGMRRELDSHPFSSKLFAEEQAEAPGRLLYKDGFSTILHLLLGSPRPAAVALHAELCQAGPRQGLSLCESLPSGAHAGTRVPPALGWEETGLVPVQGVRMFKRLSWERTGSGDRGCQQGFETVRLR